MAADVTLLSLPNSAENWRVARLKTYEDLFEDDEVLRDPETGEIFGYSSSGKSRDTFFAHFYSDVDVCQIGPLSFLKAFLLSGAEKYLPAPTVAVYDLWMSPHEVTPIMVTQTMVALNLPNRSHYENWRSGFYSSDWRGRRRQSGSVKRWLTKRMGSIVFAETW